MKRSICMCLILSLFVAVPAFAGGLETFLGRVNIQARADLSGFSAQVSTQFGIPVSRVNTVLKAVANPADAFMVFQLGAMTHQSPERVLKVYSRHHKQGWGRIAQNMGIKPGSAEFKRLKRGDLHFEESRKFHGHGKKKHRDDDQHEGKGHEGRGH